MTTADELQGQVAVRRCAAQEPYALRRLRRETEQEPVDVIREAITQTPTYDEAAARLGMSARTLRKLRAQFGIVVEDRP